MADTSQSRTAANGAATLWINGRDDRDGEATLTEILDKACGYTVHIVTINRRTAEYYGLREPADIVGGLVRTRGHWSPTAYRDRAHLFNHGAPVYFLPNAPNRMRAVHALLRWWWIVERRTRDGANPAQLDPFQEPTAFRRWLLA